MRKDPYAKERAKQKQKAQGLNDPMSKFYSLLLENAKGEKGDTPIKGKDYCTPAERKEMIADVLEKIPVPKDADPVDYDIILAYVTQEVEEQVKKEVAKIPKPKDGQPGKDAVVDIPAIVQSLLKTMPKMESKEVDYLGVKDYIDKEIKKIKAQRPQVVKSFTGGGATSLSQLVDADLSGLSKNADGQYILGSGGGSSLPDQTGNNGKFLTTDGTDPSWATIPNGGDMLTATYDPAGGAEQVAFASELHDPITVTDSAEIDFTLTDQNITASLKAGSIDETKLDASVNASLDKADSAVQPADLGAVATSNDYNDLDNKPDLSAFDNLDVYTNQADFPATGSIDVLYLETSSGTLFRWTGSAYAVISAQLALGETSSTAYRGDRGKTAYDHSQLTSGNPHNVTKSDVGLGSVDNVSAANLRDRSTHTGTQTASTISDFDTEVANNSAVAANTAKNSYPSADASKLAGIEAGADVTDTANVTAAGALMDSEVTNLAAVKAFDPADYADAVHTHTESDITDLGSYLEAGDDVKGVVVHGSTASTARPSGFTSVEWIGDVEPSNATNSDTWYDTSA